MATQDYGVYVDQQKLDQLAQAIRKAIITTGKETLKAAKENAPKDTGALRKSTFLKQTSATSVQIGFKAPYAMAIHEQLDVHHPEGEAKFLEKQLGEKAIRLLTHHLDEQIRGIK